MLMEVGSTIESKSLDSAACERMMSAACNLRRFLDQDRRPAAQPASPRRLQLLTTRNEGRPPLYSNMGMLNVVGGRAGQPDSPRNQCKAGKREPPRNVGLGEGQGAGMRIGKDEEAEGAKVPPEAEGTPEWRGGLKMGDEGGQASTVGGIGGKGGGEQRVVGRKGLKLEGVSMLSFADDCTGSQEEEAQREGRDSNVGVNDEEEEVNEKEKEKEEEEEEEKKKKNDEEVDFVVPMSPCMFDYIHLDRACEVGQSSALAGPIASSPLKEVMGLILDS
jgi:hypothetical protein